MAWAGFSTMGPARSAIRTATALGSGILAPLRNRFGAKTAWIYVILITLIVAFNVVAFVNREHFSELAADIRSWLKSRWSQEAIAPAATIPVPVVDTRPLNIFSPPRPPFFQLTTHYTFEPPYIVTRADTFRHNQTIVRLAFIEGVASNDICLNDYLARFPCGLMGRASIQNLISEQEVRCRPIFYWYDDIRYHCFIDETDIAVHQIGAGFARPDFLRVVEVTAAMKEAQNGGNGAWNGGWRLVGNEEAVRKTTLFNKLDTFKDGIYNKDTQIIQIEKIP